MGIELTLSSNAAGHAWLITLLEEKAAAAAAGTYFRQNASTAFIRLRRSVVT